MKKRSILNNLLDIDSIFKFNKISKLDGALLFLDQEKVFDRVDHSFLIETIKSFGFNEQFSNLIQNLYIN